MVTNKMINRLKGKRFDIIKFGKLIKSIKDDILDKCTEEDLIEIENSFKSNIELNPKYGLLLKLLDIRFNFGEETINFEPVYKPGKKESCIKKDYKIIEDLGSGYFGEVKLLEKESTDKKYALKKNPLK